MQTTDHNNELNKAKIQLSVLKKKKKGTLKKSW